MKRVLLLLTLSIMCVALNAQFVQQPSGIAPAWDSKLAWCDYDADGDLDLALYGDTISSSGEFLVIYNNASGTLTRDTSFLVNETNSNMEWFDFDFDNDPDLMVVGLRLHVYINNGGSFSEFYPFGSTSYFTSKIHGRDFNADGDMDFLIGDMVYLHSSAGYTGCNPDTIFFTQSSSAVADYDEDGDVDFIITGDTSVLSTIPTTLIYRNNGNSTFTAMPTGIAGASNSDIDWIDIDQDGDLDVSVCGRGLSNVRLFHIYQNNGGTFTNINAALNPISDAAVSWGDYNNDGYPDFAYCGINNSGLREAKIMVNNSGTSFTDVGAGLPAFSQGDVAWGDFDTDTDLDLMIAGNGPTGRFSSYYLNNYNVPNSNPTPPSGLSSIVTGNTAQLSWTPSADAQCNSVSLTYEISVLGPNSLFFATPLADTITGSKRVPDAGSNEQNTMAVLQGLPIGEYTWRVQSVDAGYLGSAFSASDTFAIYNPLEPALITPVNNTVGYSLTAVAFDWTPPWGSTSFHIQVATDSLFQNIVVDDSMIVISNYVAGGFNFQTIYFWRVRANNNSYIGAWSDVWRFTTKPNLDIVETGPHLVPVTELGEVKWVDFDNDNDLDLVMTGDTVSGNQWTRLVVFYENNQGQWIRTTQPNVPQQRSSPKTSWADVDNDGDLDFLMMADGPVAVAYTALFINNNGTFVLSPQSVPLVCEGNASWGDYDNDGDPDLLMCGHDPSTSEGSSVILENDNGTLIDAGFTLPPVKYGLMKWMDTDNDGDLDIVVSGDTAASQPSLRCTRIYRNDNATSFTPVTTGIENFFFQFMDFADIDNDGDMDIVGNGDSLLTNVNNNDYQCARVYKNNGGTFSLVQVLDDSIRGNVKLMDINNDGYVDVVLTGSLPTPAFGYRTSIWLNAGGNNFYPATSDPSPWRIGFGGLDLGDCDNDGDPDLAISGSDSTFSNEVSIIYRNDFTPMNSAPGAPSTLTNNVTGNQAVLTWSIGNDAQTSAPGLEYNIAMGTSLGSADELQPNSNLQTGYRRIAAHGNAGYQNTYRFMELTRGWHYWQVQTIDPGGIGSPFSPIDSFYVSIPDITVLIYPGNDSVNIPMNVQFQWLSSIGAISYQLEVATDSLFSQLILNSSGITDTFFAWQTPAYFTQYYWRIRAQNVSGFSNWSDVWHFTSESQFQAVANFGGGYAPSVADYDSDGDMDLLMMGCVSCPDTIRLLRNDSGNFVQVAGTGLPYQIGSGGSTWGDYDNDGDPDLLMYGSTINGSPYNPISRIYQNTNGVFTDINAGFTGVLQADAEWIDYDNDGDLDVSLLGRIGATGRVFRLYQNNNGIFTQDSTLVPPYWWSSMDWGDYDNDGDYDLGIAGPYIIGPTTYWTTIIYTNHNGVMTSTNTNLVSMSYNGVFRWVDVDNDGDLDASVMGAQPTAALVNTIFMNTHGVLTATNPGLMMEANCSSDWSDFDNDGDFDVLQSTTNTPATNAHNSIYSNDGNGTFALVNADVIQYFGAVRWFDYDGDGDDDFFAADSSQHCVLYRNVLLSNQFTANTSPTAPLSVSDSVAGNTISLWWPAGSDMQTPTQSLSYNIWLKKIGDSISVAASMADSATGWRLVRRSGNAGLMTTHEFYNVDSGTYVARVQTLDVQHLASAFSLPDTIVVTTPLRPTLYLPADSAITSTNVTFQWLPFPATARYQLRVAYDSLFTAVVFNDSLVPATIRNVTSLPSDTLLYWEVRAWNGTVWSLWSDTWSFNTRTLFTTTMNPGILCPYDSTYLSVSYTTPLTFAAGNVMQVQLSDANGSFASAITIGSLTSTLATDTIAVVIPPGLPAGSQYRFRTLSSNPAYIGTDNGSDIIIQPAAATASISVTDTILCIGNFDTLTFVGTGYTSFIWSTGQTTNTILTSMTGNYSVDVTDSNGCVLTKSQFVQFENCSNVWPGDANQDLSVTTADLLSIGVYNSLYGYPRDSVSMLWMGHNALNWGVAQSNGEDVKYSDCNGDGIIDATDTNAVVLNFGFTHTPRLHSPQVVQSNIPVFLTSSSPAYAPGDLVTIFVHVGDTNTPAMNIYGGNFELSYTDTAIVPGSEYRFYTPSWLGTVNTDVWALSNIDTALNSFSFALTRFDHSANSGFGIVAGFRFLIDSNAVHGDSMIISLGQAFLIDSNGVQYAVALMGCAFVIDTSASSTSESPLAGNPRLYPNPCSNELMLEMSSLRQQDITVSWKDITGKSLDRSQTINLQMGYNTVNVRIPSQLPAGMYFLEIKSGSSSQVYKVVKDH